jgi:hypothetical protein
VLSDRAMQAGTCAVHATHAYALARSLEQSRKVAAVAAHSFVAHPL